MERTAREKLQKQAEDTAAAIDKVATAAEEKVRATASSIEAEIRERLRRESEDRKVELPVLDREERERIRKEVEQREELKVREAAVMDRQHLLDEREEVLKGAERLLRRREVEIEGQAMRWAQMQTPPTPRNHGASGLAGTWPSPAAPVESPVERPTLAVTTQAGTAAMQSSGGKIGTGTVESLDLSPQDASPGQEAKGEGVEAAPPSTNLPGEAAPLQQELDEEIEEMLASVVTMKPQAQAERTIDPTNVASSPRLRNQPRQEPRGLWELTQGRRRQLKKQRAALLVELERWRLDCAGASPAERPALVEMKSRLDERYALVLEGIRETRAVERTLLHLRDRDTTAGPVQTEGLLEYPSMRPSTAAAEVAARNLVERWRAERLPGSMSRRSGASSARYASSAVPAWSAHRREALTARDLLRRQEVWPRGLSGTTYADYA